jgi:hypothetical protein
MLLLIFEYPLKVIPTNCFLVGLQILTPLLQTQKYIPTSILTPHCLIQHSHTHALGPRNTADNKYHVVTVRGFTSDGYAK